MAPPRKVSHADVRSRFLAGEKPSAIAAALGVHPQHVRKIVKNLQPPPPPRLSFAFVLSMVASVVHTHGPNYGRGLLMGALRRANASLKATYGVCAPKAAIRKALDKVAPLAQRARANWGSLRLPRGSYHAPHFGYAWHMDYDAN